MTLEFIAGRPREMEGRTEGKRLDESQHDSEGQNHPEIKHINSQIVLLIFVDCDAR